MCFLNVFVFVIVFVFCICLCRCLFVGQVMFSHHSDHMSKRSKLSKIALWWCSLNVFVIVFVIVFVFAMSIIIIMKIYFVRNCSLGDLKTTGVHVYHLHSSLMPNQTLPVAWILLLGACFIHTWIVGFILASHIKHIFRILSFPLRWPTSNLHHPDE